MSHGQPPHIQSVVPCECGSHEAYWHGPVDGARTYCCDDCWDRHCEGCGEIPGASGCACDRNVFDDGPQDTRGL